MRGLGKPSSGELQMRRQQCEISLNPLNESRNDHQRNKYIEIRLIYTIAADEIAPIAKIFAPSFPTPSMVRKNPIEAMIGARLILAITANVSE